MNGNYKHQWCSSKTFVLFVRVELELALSYIIGQQPLRIRTVVRNRNGFRYGLEYMSLNSADREMLLKCPRLVSHPVIFSSLERLHLTLHA